MFWSEIPPCEHLVQIYESTATFLDALEGFVAGGLRAGDGAVVIATPCHLEALRGRLDRQGFDVPELAAEDRYIALDAVKQWRASPRRTWPRSGFTQDPAESISDICGAHSRVVPG
ncbi:MAG TPA: MEDS domain-containing protein [Phycisphaerales bacterium]|nr:MEDS domain-containing protein [Phycisphaerales bacterium]